MALLFDKIDAYICNIKNKYIELEKKYHLNNISKLDVNNHIKEFVFNYKELNKLLEHHDQYKKIDNEIKKNNYFAKIENNTDMKLLITNEINNLKIQLNFLEKEVYKIIKSYICTNARESIIIEIRSAVGGSESNIFVDNLYKMYNKFAIIKNWKNELLNFTPSNTIGTKQVIFSLTGKSVRTYMELESGVHRVQRIPKTESKGRIHTSTVTVSALPEIKEIELKIQNDDLRFDFFKSSGPGGQSVNTTDSAVRVTHIPTGLVATSQIEKSQHRNKAIALRILRTKIYDNQKNKKLNEQAKIRKKQIGKGNRNEKIKTYNFHQNRITDHRYNITTNNLTAIINGELEPLYNEIFNILIIKKLNHLSQLTII